MKYLAILTLCLFTTSLFADLAPTETLKAGSSGQFSVDASGAVTTSGNITGNAQYATDSGTVSSATFNGALGAMQELGGVAITAGTWYCTCTIQFAFDAIDGTPDQVFFAYELQYGSSFTGARWGEQRGVTLRDYSASDSTAERAIATVAYAGYRGATNIYCAAYKQSGDTGNAAAAGRLVCLKLGD